ncbi:uncharacterized protein LOC132904258 [Amyelois transitella]|uniref:uncharacterized protein LOC132902076 n=1 Tax=Amyelois transitella TaxID=680683 RepID=UPI00299040E2|nr:uncharacterized protein LOC132902076 [Amyelois transitella]XP_060808745.1 uncharacterized protein LOC106132228 isoform X1 [Amyelois transitella]XP_060810168.1 uncharacterized protein LOC132904258 [Amyelois transitella]
MPRPRTQTREERLEKRRLYERRRKERIKSNAETREEFLKKDRERYARKKAAGLIVSRHQMNKTKLRNLRRRNNISAAAYYQRKKKRATTAPTATRANSLVGTVQDHPEQSSTNQIGEDINNPGLSTSCQDSPSSTARPARCNTLRHSLRLNSRSSISTNIQPQHTATTTSRPIYTSSPRQTPLSRHRNFVDNNNPGPSTSRQDYPSSSLRPTRCSMIRRCLRMNSDSSVSSDVQHHIYDNVVTTTPCVLPSSAQRIPSPSNLSSIESTLCPNSPVSESSITSVELRRALKDKFRIYQRTKNKLITELQNKLLQVSREKEMLKKRCNRLQSSYINLKKNTQKVEKKTEVVIKSDKKKKQYLTRVVTFLEDDENSTICPGKNDTISRHGLKKQKRLMTDTLKNLHLKYLKSGEPPISYSTFSRLKPFWIIQPNVNARNTCLCEKHENMKLLIESMKRNRLIKENTISDVLNSLCCSKDNIDCLQRTCSNCKSRLIDYQEFDNGVHVTYWNWEKNKSTYTKNSVEKSAIKVEKVRHWVKPLDLIKKFENSLKAFLQHCLNNKNQNQAFKTLKENMTTEDCIIQIDFSENYTTKYGSEIQSLHFGGSRKQFTLHTAVIYFKLNNETCKTQSFCTVSTSLRHDAAAVWAHLVPILREIEITAPLVRNLYIISDSPSAQYRNKKILYIISQLSSYCPMLTHIVWNYCECGHGKSAADGVGGVLKRTLDKQVAYQHDITNIEVLVQNLKSFVQGVKIEVVEDYQITEKDWLLPKDLKTFAGTMKVHQVVWSKESGNRLALRHLSCVERECLNKIVMCPHGKHLGFHDLTETQLPTFVNTTNMAQLRPIQLTEKLVLRPKPSKEKKHPKKRSSIITELSIHSIQNIDISVLKPSTSKSPVGMNNQKEETGQESSMIPKSLLEKYENFIEFNTPSCSFFDNPDTALLEKYEQSNSDSEQEIKTKVKRRPVKRLSSSSSTSDLNIFD